MKIEIKCKGAINLNPLEIVEFQGELKSLSTQNYERLKRSILTLGYSFPECIWFDHQDGLWKCLDGHQRLRVIKQMIKEGYECDLIPCSIVEAKDRKEAKRKLLAAASSYGSVESQGLYEFMNEADLKMDELVKDFNFPEVDFNEFQKEFFEDVGSSEEIEGQDDVPDPLPEPKIELGEVYLLGGHRLLCGDSTDILQVEKLMNGEKADMVFTDPPYGMNLDTDYSSMVHKDGRSGNKFKPIIGDDKDFDPGIIFGLFDYVKEMFLFGADYYCQHLPKDGAWLVWDKRESERVGSQMSEKMFGSMFELCWSKQKHKRFIFRIMWAGGTGQGESEDRKGRNNCLVRSHPSQKPIELCEEILKKWGKDQDKVVDLFGGSGSTLIACEKTKRKCFIMELDPNYCGIILDRWAKFTGKDPVREIDNKPWSEIRQ